MGFMQIRNMPDDTREAITQAAKARGWSVAKYISRLYGLHQALLHIEVQPQIKEALKGFELQGVTR